jgi:hypothetical protein
MPQSSTNSFKQYCHALSEGSSSPSIKKDTLEAHRAFTTYLLVLLFQRFKLLSKTSGRFIHLRVV